MAILDLAMCGLAKTTTIKLEYGERIIGMKGKTFGNLVQQLTLITKKKDGSTAIYGPFGIFGVKPISFYGNIMVFAGTAKSKSLSSISV